MSLIVKLNFGLTLFWVFKWIMYSFARKHTTRVKIDKKFHEDKNVMEVAYAWISTMWLFCAMRVATALIVIAGQDVFTNRLYLWGSFCLQVYLVQDMIRSWHPAFNTKTVIRHNNWKIPIGLNAVEFMCTLAAGVYHEIMIFNV